MTDPEQQKASSERLENFTIPDNGLIHFPAWLLVSGLPAMLSNDFRSPQVWLIFRTIVELDCARNLAPGVVEISATELCGYCGVDPEKISALVKKLRKAGVLRAFIADHPDEENLFQVITPLPTPVTIKQIREANLRWNDMPVTAFRYSTDQPADVSVPQVVTKENKFQRVLEMYLNTVSSRMNTFIQDELILISETYDEKLISKVFSKARTKQVQNLGWIIRNIHSEKKAKAKTSSKNNDRKGQASGDTDLQKNDEIYGDD